MITSNYSLAACDDYLSARVKCTMDEQPVTKTLITTYTSFRVVMNFSIHFRYLTLSKWVLYACYPNQNWQMNFIMPKAIYLC